MAGEDIEGQTARSMDADGHIRERVRELTLAAIRERRFDPAAMQALMRRLTDGLSEGAQRQGDSAREVLAEGWKGVDEAFGKSAHALSLALSELTSRGRELSDTEARDALEALRHLDRDLLVTLGAAAERAGGRVREGWQALADHAVRTGTDSGAVFTRAASEFSSRLAGVARDTAATGTQAGLVLGERLTQVASGLLAGLSDSLRPGATPSAGDATSRRP